MTRFPGLIFASVLAELLHCFCSEATLELVERSPRFHFRSYWSYLMMTSLDQLEVSLVEDLTISYLESATTSASLVPTSTISANSFFSKPQFLALILHHGQRPQQIHAAGPWHPLEPLFVHPWLVLIGPFDNFKSSSFNDFRAWFICYQGSDTIFLFGFPLGWLVSPLESLSYLV